jgi:Poly A polymerase head domain
LPRPEFNTSSEKEIEMYGENNVVSFSKLAKSGISFPYLAELLKVAQQYDPNARISGGCLRDLILKRPVKDIDLFVHQNAVEDVDRDFMLKNGFSLIRSSSGNYGFRDREVHVATDYKAPGGAIVSLIGMVKKTTLDEHLARHDFGCCRVAFDGTSVHRHPDFDRDIAAKEFVLRRCESKDQFLRSMIRYDRISKKYEDWRLVVPPGMLKFFGKKDADHTMPGYTEIRAGVRGR